MDGVFCWELIVAGPSDWGCVLIPTGLPAELIPHNFPEVETSGKEMLKQETFYEVQSWGCVSALLGLPAELIPHIFSLCPATCVIIPAAPPFVNLFCKVFSVNWTVQAHRPGTAPSTQNSASRRQALPEGCAVIFVPVTACAWNQSGTLCPHGCAGYWPGASR